MRKQHIGTAPIGSLVSLVALAFVVCAIAWAAHSRFNFHPHGLPAGCDEFGYLNMARAIADGKTFTDHAERDFLPELLEELQASFPNVNDYRWMIAPHAYHLADSGDRIINQYPPGVGMILAPIPIEYRRIAFPVVSAVIGCLALIAAACLDARRRSLWPLVLLPGIALGLALSPPVALELRRVDSLAPTYGLLIACGWLLPRRPLWALAFLSATTVFRVPNALLFVPLGLACLLHGRYSGWMLAMQAKRVAVMAVAVLCGGFGLYLAYAWLRLGSPFAPTYSSIDQAFANLEEFRRNLDFYFISHRQWLAPHLFSVATLAAVTLYRRQHIKWLLFGIGLSLFNYAFYLLHKVQIDYYPYASALICLGLAIGCLDLESVGLRLQRVLAALGVAMSIALALTQPWPQLSVSEDFQANVAPLRHAFADFDVVWAEHRSGTVEYATNTAGFRYNWGPEQARIHILRWLAERGFRQAIWVSDKDMKPREEIDRSLSSARLSYSAVEDPAVGLYYVVGPAWKDGKPEH